jgi:hypothetical protein
MSPHCDDTLLAEAVVIASWRRSLDVGSFTLSTNIATAHVSLSDLILRCLVRTRARIVSLLFFSICVLKFIGLRLKFLLWILPSTVSCPCRTLRPRCCFTVSRPKFVDPTP